MPRNPRLSSIAYSFGPGPVTPAVRALLYANVAVYIASLFYYDPEPSLARLKGFQALGEHELPLVWKHRSGRKSLILGCTAHRVLGVSPAKSAEILIGLREWATSEQFSYSHEWKVGDLVMWDNTGTMHRAEPYDLTSGRMLHRTKLQGEESFL